MDVKEMVQDVWTGLDWTGLMWLKIGTIDRLLWTR